MSLRTIGNREPMAVDSKRPHILFTVNADWVFRIHFLPFARLLKERGYQITVAARDTGDAQSLGKDGLHFLHWPVSRSGKNPFSEAYAVYRLWRLVRAVRPDMVHHIGVKAVCYGSAVCRLLRIPAVHMFIGLGFAFRNSRGRTSRVLLGPWLRRVGMDRGSVLVYQNESDRAYGVSHGWGAPERSYVVGGVGVDPRSFSFAPEPAVPPHVVLLASRMLWDKGIGEFVEAARILRKEGGDRLRFVLAGGSDRGNPAAVPRRTLEAWHREGVVEWLGFCHNMPQVLRASHVIVLPSYYGEGVPKILLEAAATGRAAVTTDWPGCRDAVRHEETGLLVPPRDSRALAEAIGYLVGNPDERRRMGENARMRAEREFGVEHFTEKMLAVYRCVLHGLRH